MEPVAKSSPKTVEFGSSMIVAKIQSGEGPPGSQQMRLPSSASEWRHFEPPFVQNDKVVAEKWQPTTLERPWSPRQKRVVCFMNKQ